MKIGFIYETFRKFVPNLEIFPTFFWVTGSNI